MTTIGPAIIPLPPCTTEDSPDCYWDANSFGNGLGYSWVNYNGGWMRVDLAPNEYIVSAEAIWTPSDPSDYTSAPMLDFNVVTAFTPTTTVTTLPTTIPELPRTGSDPTGTIGVFILAAILATAGIATVIRSARRTKG